jgi:hypothetical protein
MRASSIRTASPKYLWLMPKKVSINVRKISTVNMA